MAVVHHQITGLDGATPAALSAVRIDLVTGDLVPVAYRKSTSTGLATRLDITPTATGWTADLTRQSDIAPDGSVYRVTEYLAGGGQPVVWWFAVPDGAGPFELTGILTTAPAGLPPAIVISQTTVTGGGSGSSSQLTTTGTAAVVLSGHRVVTPTAAGLVYASNTTAGHLTAPLWITNAAAAAGATVSVVIAGPVTEPTWTWTPGPVFLGAGGVLTQTPPSGPPAFLAQVGYATSATTLVVDRQPSTILA